MKSAFIKSKARGMTLIEVTIYVTLLSILLFGYIRSFYGVTDTNMKTLDDIHESFTKGFIAMVAILMLAIASTLILTVVSLASYSYTDSVMRREVRIQERLNLESCLDHIELMLAGDYFLRGPVKSENLACQATITQVGIDLLNIAAKTSTGHVDFPIATYGDETILFGEQDLQRVSRNIY